MPTIDLNADLGETVDGIPTADDDAMFALITSANIACGGHAGDAESMRQAVARAREHGVAVGAHPSYPDRAAFGRVALRMPEEDLRRALSEQLAALESAGADVRYVKPHGALYHAVTHDPADARALVGAVRELSDRLGRAVPILGMPGTIERLATAAGLRFVLEGFLDRGYRADGTLVPRGEPGAIIDDPARIAGRAVVFATDQVVDVDGGERLRLPVASVCVHGDSPGAVDLARAARGALDAHGIRVAAPW